MKINILITILFAAILTACGGNKQQNQANTQEESTASNDLKQTETIVQHPGKEVYNSVCLACHMADGSGVPGMHPPLIETDWVNGDKERLIKLVLQGVSGKLEVEGDTYNSIMPPQAHLTNQQIADVLSYVRQNFGNDASPVTEEEVQQVRNSL